MKKQFVFAAASMIALAFTSCKKYEVSEALDLSSLPTVTVSGNMFAELDKSNSTKEHAPAGLQITVSIPYTEYNKNGKNGNHIVSTKTDADGNFSIRVPVVSEGVDATVSFESFTATVIDSIGADGKVLETKTHFELASKSVSGLGSGNSTSVFKLGTLIYTESGTDPNAGVITYVPSASITYEGTLNYDKEVRDKVGSAPNTLDSTDIFKPVPAGLRLTVKTVSTNEDGDEYTETKTVTTTSGGKYKIVVPMDQYGEAKLSIESSEILEFTKVKDPNNEKSLYKYELTVVDEQLYFVNYTNKDKDYTKGTFIKDLD